MGAKTRPYFYFCRTQKDDTKVNEQSGRISIISYAQYASQVTRKNGGK